MRLENILVAGFLNSIQTADIGNVTLQNVNSIL
jgi:hypothetical protein